MIPFRMSVLILACAIFWGGTVADTVMAQAWEAAKADGKAFGQSLQPTANANARATPTADSVPGFTANPPQSNYSSNPDALKSDAAAQAPSNTGYATVTSSVQNRVQFAPSEITATLAPSKDVVTNASSYVSGYGGSQGECHDLPGGQVSPGTYEQACNAGYSASTSDQSCAIPLIDNATTLYNYDCSDGGNGVPLCTPFDGCNQIAERPGRCLQYGGPTGKDCVEPGNPIYTMQCQAAVSGYTPVATVPTYTTSPDDSACASLAAQSSCSVDADVCTDSSPTERVVGGVAVQAACWAWSRTYHCSGVDPTPKSDCGQLEQMGCTFKRETCITGETPCLTVDRVYDCPIPAGPAQKQQICDGNISCIDGHCDTIDRTPGTEFGNAVVALNVATQAGRELDPNKLTLFSGTRYNCSKTIFGLTNCCTPRGLPFIGGCNSEDVALHKEREKGVCSFVGTFCSSSFLGVCLQKKETHCCFASKISRILQEQGRPQIGKTWGDPKTEQCVGFTIAEFQRLDLSKMDFSEVYSDFEAAAKLPDEMNLVGDMQAKINAFYGAHHP